jgi:hypothetical protein
MEEQNANSTFEKYFDLMLSTDDEIGKRTFVFLMQEMLESGKVDLSPEYFSSKLLKRATSKFDMMASIYLLKVALGEITSHANKAAAISAEEQAQRVFISYSWDNEIHKEWVLALSNRLIENGVDVILDRYELTAGKHISFFAENSIASSDKVLMIFTRGYKRKADQRVAGVGYEYSLINRALYENQVRQDKFIPVLRDGSMAESVPEFMKQYIYIDMTNDGDYERNVEVLLKTLLGVPLISKPSVGNNPKFAD